MCVLHFQHFSIWTSHISSAQQPHVASGCCIGQHRLERSILTENSSGQYRYRAGGPGFESPLDCCVTLGKILLRGSVSTKVRINIVKKKKINCLNSCLRKLEKYQVISKVRRRTEIIKKIRMEIMKLKTRNQQSITKTTAVSLKRPIKSGNL